MLAIPVLRSRVAPVLNWCSSIRLFPHDPSYQGSGQEVNVSHLEAGQRLEFLREKGVRTLICGALSPDLRHYAKKLGIKIVCGVAGGIDEVRRSFWHNQLDQPQFWLPGCRGPRRYRSGFRGGGRGCPGMGKASTRGRASAERGEAFEAGTRAGDACVCPDCGFRHPHERGIPCYQVSCPRCGQALVRE
jgi:predicted Fe-Mo cluster-binding NifX family protein